MISSLITKISVKIVNKNPRINKSDIQTNNCESFSKILFFIRVITIKNKIAIDKEKIVNNLIKKLNLKKNQIVGIGDAANDMNMLLSVGLPIAFEAQDIVKANFDNQINNTDLTSVLYFLGIKH